MSYIIIETAAWKEGKMDELENGQGRFSVWTPVSPSTWISVNAPNNFPSVSLHHLRRCFQVELRESKAADTWSMCVTESSHNNQVFVWTAILSLSCKNRVCAVWLWSLCNAARWHGHSDNRFKCLHGSNNTSDGQPRSQQEQDRSQLDLLHKKRAGLRGGPRQN